MNVSGYLLVPPRTCVHTPAIEFKNQGLCLCDCGSPEDLQGSDNDDLDDQLRSDVAGVTDLTTN